MVRAVVSRTLAELRPGLFSPRLNIRGCQQAPVVWCRRPFSESHFQRGKIETVFSPEAVAPIGPYSQAVKANGLVFLSGQIPAEPNGKLIEGTISEKTHKVCQNARAVLEAAGSSLEQVVKVTFYLQDFGDLKEVNEVYIGYFPRHPARTALESARLPAGAFLEMDIIALQ